MRYHREIDKFQEVWRGVKEFRVKAKIYTKTGDKGQTSLVGGTRVAKTNPRLEAYGTLDELNSVIGVLLSHLTPNLGAFDGQVMNSLREVQNNLFNIGSRLACEDEKLSASLPSLRAGSLARLETDMDKWEGELPPLKNFILPGGSPLAAFAHQARTICRRAERATLRVAESEKVAGDHIIYLNRLSDWFFLLAREFNHRLKVDDPMWEKD